MNQGSRNSSSPVDEAPGFLSSWAVKLALGAVGLFGASGILYGLGFLVLRSHYSLLGVWGGVPSSTTEIVDEGGRFIYHLIYLPVSLLTPLHWQTLGVLLTVGLLWDLGPRLYRWLKKNPLPLRTDLLNRFVWVLPTFFLVIILAGTAILLETIWHVLNLHDVLHSPTALPDPLKDEQARHRLYGAIVLRAFGGLLISWSLYRLFWSRSSVIQRGLIVAQWLLVFAAGGMVPIAYGKLALPVSYPLIKHPHVAPCETLLLLRDTSNGWIAWNATRKQTEILPRTEKERVSIGPRRSILQPWPRRSLPSWGVKPAHEPLTSSVDGNCHAGLRT